MLDIAYKNPLHFSLLEYILFDSINFKKSTQENVLTKQIQKIIAIIPKTNKAFRPRKQLFIEDCLSSECMQVVK